MLSSSNIERLIAEKRHEIEREKLVMGLSPPVNEQVHQNVRQDTETADVRKQVSFTDIGDHPYHNDSADHQKEKNLSDTKHQELDDSIPPDLERYIRMNEDDDLTEMQVFKMNDSGKANAISTKQP
ncbi:hypothetical protein B5X24_HaOG205152 [Helicoverpa armigera]|uniref:Uncharacterized protein n=1 Tax=Helicoverpa armigera TaxID=29058 RepID=A0A2W1BR04_HELAM|nr:hypothetical protein B5X24_HaOG205152 [Helicoverpa armigera]